MTLAIVDDDDDVRRGLARLLNAMGHQVRLFASAEQFESDPTPVDCVILDVRLPGLTGIELRERLRQRTPPSAVVLITGDGDQPAREIPRYPDTPLVIKPFDAELLTTAITDAIAVTTQQRDRHGS